MLRYTMAKQSSHFRNIPFGGIVKLLNIFHINFLYLKINIKRDNKALVIFETSLSLTYLTYNHDNRYFTYIQHLLKKLNKSKL